ncbi:hypothetical protein [Peribacillus deserti]|uniref:Uncharacterized protein n=1 Tax=Peribacillus deserti TaxID=673318 RepID=A0A2N5M3E8_9BACI|nr:hypothetical protein [Peribacillus deserti]PLT28862.1 hypothetical protein CUU66_16065 [Peribacillus deserti]
MKINSFTFTHPPVLHIFPSLYEGLGLPELSAYTEQRFLFTYSLGKLEGTGNGSIRLKKKNKEFDIVILEKLPGVGPIKLKNVKDLLIREAKDLFVANIQGEPNLRKVYHSYFRKSI